MEFASLAVLLVFAALFGVIAKTLKQPLLIGYLFAGLILALFGVIKDTHSIENLGKIGVTLLLFLVGLEMNVKELPSVGKVALLTGIGQIVFTCLFGFLIATLLKFGILPSLYIAIALTFSSTIIIIKLLSEKNDLSSLYGRISIGFLLVQDLVAILILIFLSSLGANTPSVWDFLLVIGKALLLFVVVWLLSKKALPYFFDRFAASSQELLFIVSVAWALGMATFVAGPLGLTLEIGGFIAGLALSSFPEHLQIASKTRSLRDFFLTIFFLYLGTKLVVGDLSSIIVPAVVFSSFVLIGNPLIVMIIMGLLGYRKRTGFLAGLTVAQISEFSLIVMAMGASLGHLSERDVALVVLVGIITMTGSTYLILGSNKIYEKIKGIISVFEKRNPREVQLSKSEELNDHVVLVGANRTGKSLIAFFKKREIPFTVVDFDPTTFNRLTADNVAIMFGDITDHEILEQLNLGKARMFVSTISLYEESRAVLDFLRRKRINLPTIFTVATPAEAIKLYELGASYVAVPEVTAGEYLRHIFENHGTKGEKIKILGQANFRRITYAYSKFK